MRLVRGERGSVDMLMELAIRFDYGLTIPWVRKTDYGLTATSGNNVLQLETPVETVGRDYRTFAEFRVKKGEVVPFVLTYYDSLEPPSRLEDAEKLSETTDKWWQDWGERLRLRGPMDGGG